MELYSVTTTYLKTMLSQGGLFTGEEWLALLAEIDGIWSYVWHGLGVVLEPAREGAFFNLYFKLKKCYQLNTSFSIALCPFARIFNGSHTTHDESWRQRRWWPSFGITDWFVVPGNTDRQYGDSCGFPLVIVNLWIEATVPLFFQLWLPTTAMKTLRTKPRIACLSLIQINVFVTACCPHIRGNVIVTQSFGIWSFTSRISLLMINSSGEIDKVIKERIDLIRSMSFLSCFSNKVSKGNSARRVTSLRLYNFASCLNRWGSISVNISKFRRRVNRLGTYIKLRALIGPYRAIGLTPPFPSVSRARCRRPCLPP